MTKEEMVAVFNEWSRRATDRPEDFGDAPPVPEYGEVCAEYMFELKEQIFNEFQLHDEGVVS